MMASFDRLATEAKAAAKIEAKLAASAAPSVHSAEKASVSRTEEVRQLNRHKHEIHCIAVELGLARMETWRYREQRSPIGFGREAIENQRAPKTTPTAVASALLELADLMEAMGNNLCLLGGQAEKHGYEMRGAADMAREWAEEVKSITAAHMEQATAPAQGGEKG